MAELRLKALALVQERTTERVFPPSDKVSDYFAQDAFTLDKMKANLSPDVYKRVAKAIEKGSKIDAEVRSTNKDRKTLSD